MANHALSSTINLLEVIWTFFGLVGVTVSLWALVDVLEDLRAARARGIRVLELVAQAEVVKEGFRIFMNALVVAIGVAAMIQEEPPGGVDFSTVGKLIVFGLLTLPICATAITVTAFSMRKAVAREVGGG